MTYLPSGVTSPVLFNKFSLGILYLQNDRNLKYKVIFYCIELLESINLHENKVALDHSSEFCLQFSDIESAVAQW